MSNKIPLETPLTYVEKMWRWPIVRSRSLELPAEPYKIKASAIIRSISENMHRSVHYAVEQPYKLTINWLLSIC